MAGLTAAGIAAGAMGTALESKKTTDLSESDIKRYEEKLAVNSLGGDENPAEAKKNLDYSPYSQQAKEDLEKKLGGKIVINPNAVKNINLGSNPPEIPKVTGSEKNMDANRFQIAIERHKKGIEEAENNYKKSVTELESFLAKNPSEEEQRTYLLSETFLSYKKQMGINFMFAAIINNNFSAPLPSSFNMPDEKKKLAEKCRSMP